MHTTLSSNEIDRLARRRARAKLGFFLHAAVYLAVNLVLGMAAYSAGRTWAIYPALGWTVALLVHGAVVVAFTGGIYSWLVDRERQRLSAQRDPW